MSDGKFQDLWEKLTAGDESVEIEAKRGEEAGPSLLETICAFANEPGRCGGYILLGVGVGSNPLFRELRYDVVGVRNPDQLQADLANKCRELFNITIRPLIEVEEADGKNVVIVYVAEAQPQEKPVYIKAKGLHQGAFRRIGSTDQRCTDEDIAMFYQLRDHRSFDETVVSDANPDDLDPQAIAEYRRARAHVNPDAAELKYSDEDLLHALAATSKTSGGVRPTIAGLVLLGKQASLRRHFPMMRVDYIRVPGREWVPDPERRYQAVEMAGPLLMLIPRVIATILDDIPKAFSLAKGQIHRRDVPLLPQTVIREAVVNALMHRSYRIRGPAQIIRYANRIELHNPGHSLVPDERLGEPGSISRNERIAAVLHEVGLAETKGTGIRAMREAMDKANLTTPFFESDRQRDSFTVTLLVHHLLGPEDLAWLGKFKDCELSEDETRALIVLREVGAINNAYYRSINHLDTLTSSGHLRRLREVGLLEQKGKGSATFYVPGPRFLAATASPKAKKAQTPAEPLRREQPALRPESDPLRPELARLRPELPPELVAELDDLTKRTTPEHLGSLLVKLCAWRPLSLPELSALTGRSTDHLRRRNLRRLLADRRIRYVYPGEPNHPHQKYTAGKESK